MMAKHERLVVLLLWSILLHSVTGWIQSSENYPRSASQRHLGQETTTLTARSTPTDTTTKLDWHSRVRQLYEYSLQHGHTRVPKRYPDNPALARWVSKQRQEYRRWQNGQRPCAMTEERVTILEELGFCWDASQSRLGQDQWFSSYQQLSNFTSCSEVPRHSPLGAWLVKQRDSYANQDLDSQRVQLLVDYDPDWWMSRREWQWERRYRELVEYQRQHGDCCVPISHANKALAHWVSNQRKQYNLRCQGKLSDLTEGRQQKLEAVGFAWSRWDFEFSKNDLASR